MLYFLNALGSSLPELQVIWRLNLPKENILISLTRYFIKKIKCKEIAEDKNYILYKKFCSVQMTGERCSILAKTLLTENFKKSSETVRKVPTDLTHWK